MEEKLRSSEMALCSISVEKLVIPAIPETCYRNFGAPAESVLLIPDVLLNGASDMTSQTVTFQQSVTLENRLAHSSVSHHNEEWENKNVKYSVASDRATLKLGGHHTMEEINKQENAYSGSINNRSDETNCVEKTLHASDCKGKEGVDDEPNGEVNAVNDVCYTVDEGSAHYSAEIITQPQDANHVPGFKISGKNVISEDLTATDLMFSDGKCKTQLHCKSHDVLVNPGSLSHSREQDVSNDSDTSVPGDRRPSSVNCVPLGGTSPNATKPNSWTSDISDGVCKASELQSGVDENDAFVVKTSAANCPVGMSQTSSVVTENDTHYLKEEFIAVQTELRSSESGSQVDQTNVGV
ncbi:hypothetical protein Acr_23g0020050 [Actinidia rufa]|uniref:Uncharacterized protein n=1 Tax=Actinidia rufa TaxID=165716 RepID=A0A7J0GS20_9ERIC|nr:hypothetical protein Acr_23g0020050 [Actinidia rufa]